MYTYMHITFRFPTAVLYAREIEDDNFMSNNDKEDNFDEVVSRQVQ